MEIPLRDLLYGKRKEYCLVLGKDAQILQRYEGTFASVAFDWKSLMQLILSNKVSCIIHSHPYGYGTAYSALDKSVFEGWAVATGRLLVHVITDFTGVTIYVVLSSGKIVSLAWRQISLWESIKNYPWGLDLSIAHTAHQRQQQYVWKPYDPR